jgi:hypothetical protein
MINYLHGFGSGGTGTAESSIIVSEEEEQDGCEKILSMYRDGAIDDNDDDGGYKPVIDVLGAIGIDDVPEIVPGTFERPANALSDAWVDFVEDVPKAIAEFGVALYDFAYACTPADNDGKGKSTAGWPIKIPFAVLPKHSVLGDAEMVVFVNDSVSLQKALPLLHNGLPQTAPPMLEYRRNSNVLCFYDVESAVNRIAKEASEARERPSTKIAGAWDLMMGMPEFASKNLR